MRLQRTTAAALALLLPWLAGFAPVAHDPPHRTVPVRRLTAGAWESAGGGPALYSEGRWYELDLRPSTALPGTAVTTMVYWRWSLARTPPGLQVRLCRATVRTCIDISGRQSGGTRAFAGRGADTVFILAYWVPGSRAMAPVYGGSDRIIVNYTLRR